MPIFECQACDFLTQFEKEAKEHNEKDRSHFFKRLYKLWSIKDELLRRRRNKK
jgi:hypothetical protein